MYIMTSIKKSCICHVPARVKNLSAPDELLKIHIHKLRYSTIAGILGVIYYMTVVLNK